MIYGRMNWNSALALVAVALIAVTLILLGAVMKNM
jgi:hypothetical protein